MATIGTLIEMTTRRVLNSFETEECVDVYLRAWDERIMESVNSELCWTDEYKAFQGRFSGEVILEGSTEVHSNHYELSRLLFDGQLLAIVRRTGDKKDDMSRMERERLQYSSVRLLDDELAVHIEHELLKLFKEGNHLRLRQCSSDEDAEDFLNLDSVQVADLETGVLTFLDYQRLILITGKGQYGNQPLAALCEVENGRLFCVIRLEDGQKEQLVESQREGMAILTTVLKEAVEDINKTPRGLVMVHLSGCDGDGRQHIGLVKEYSVIHASSGTSHSKELVKHAEGEEALTVFETMAIRMMESQLGIEQGMPSP